MDWYLMVWKKFAVFSGRSRRKEYWMFFLINSLIGAALWIPGVVFRQVGMGVVIPNSGIGLIFFCLYFAYLLAVIIPCLAVSVRRLHDTGKSGWMFLLVLIPIVGPIILLVFFVLEGNSGVNQYGQDPKLA
jgi:uncharacterized membrane protein YhaH (DUF805 family)